MIDVSSRASRRLFYQSKAWRELRQQALERDHFECQWCSREGKTTTTLSSVLEVDHIMELEYYPDQALELDNLRTLCKECHNKRHHRFQYRQSAKSKERKFREDEWWG